MTAQEPAYLAFEDGSIFEGRSFAATGTQVGEVVFNTSLTGYQEILTDPSYARQIVTMTYPLIGNYGINDVDLESARPWVDGFVVREYCPYPSNWRSNVSLGDWLAQRGIIGIEGVDTRAITRKLRVKGSLKGTLGTGDVRPDDLVERAREWSGMGGLDCVPMVTRSEREHWTDGVFDVSADSQAKPESPRYRVVAIDFGVKRNILRLLRHHGCDVTVVPARTSVREILDLKPDGVFISNGPGDPGAVTYGIETVRGLIKHGDSNRLPMFGICLGHQILTWALGGRTFKMKFGHRGGNQPVQDLSTGKVEITSQNHGFVTDPDSLGDHVKVTHMNLNDDTVEGLAHSKLPIFSVQYHPEASPGPHDAGYLFDRFTALMDNNT
jgi:carbamoyl-phosphate synthase small subunit